MSGIINAPRRRSRSREYVCLRVAAVAVAAARIHLLEGDGRLTGTLIYAAAGVAFARYLSWESLRLAFSITTRSRPASLDGGRRSCAAPGRG